MYISFTFLFLSTKLALPYNFATHPIRFRSLPLPQQMVTMATVKKLVISWGLPETLFCVYIVYYIYILSIFLTYIYIFKTEMTMLPSHTLTNKSIKKQINDSILQTYKLRNSVHVFARIYNLRKKILLFFEIKYNTSFGVPLNSKKRNYCIDVYAYICT